MSTELTYNQAFDLLPLYVLGALEPEEMLAVDAVIQAHPELTTRLQELEETVSQLAFAAPAVPLPPDVRHQLLDRMRVDKDESAAFESAPAIVPLTEAFPASSVPRQRSTVRASTSADQRRWFTGFNGWAVATACLLVVLVIVGSYSFQLRTRLTQIQAQTVTLQQTNQQLRDALLQRQAYIARVIQADRSVALASTRPDRAASGAFTLNGAEGEFLVSGLAPLPSNQTYQAWLVPPGGTPTSVGLLSVAPDGTATLRVTLPTALRTFSIADISIERAGGSEVITKETIVLRGTTS